LPKRFMLKYKGIADALKANQHVLTTHYGIYTSIGTFTYFYRHPRHNGASITDTTYKFKHPLYSYKQVSNEFVSDYSANKRMYIS
jgi:hypothetical protein